MIFACYGKLQYAEMTLEAGVETAAQSKRGQATLLRRRRCPSPAKFGTSHM
jgi:hypothetical protein